MIQTILTAFAFSFFITDISGWVKPNTILWRKPFNCLPCLSVWSALIIYAQDQVVKDYLTTAFITPYVAILLKNLFHNLYKKTITK